MGNYVEKLLYKNPLTHTFIQRHNSTFSDIHSGFRKEEKRAGHYLKQVSLVQAMDFEFKKRSAQAREKVENLFEFEGCKVRQSYFLHRYHLINV